ncbi:hypothetical protein BDW_03270 [Bdellovibrio bacteriovorus W]|nr:hypothetical protein BDW_03270 [Bdellovibrio bacteriovorus W]
MAVKGKSKKGIRHKMKRIAKKKRMIRVKKR